MKVERGKVRPPEIGRYWINVEHWDAVAESRAVRP